MKCRCREPTPDRMLCDHALKLAQVGALAMVIAGCATPPPAPQTPASVAAVAADPVINRDDDFVIVAVRDGDTLGSLAQRYLGDSAKAWWIAEFNGTSVVQAKQAIVIPLRMRNPIGVFTSGYQTIPILCYHRFGARVSKLNVSPTAFEAQMEYLASNGYTVIPLTRLASFQEGKEPLPAKTVAITLDDGYRSTFEIAYPILRKYGFPATVFLYTDFALASDAMTWTQMKEMMASGLIEIQPHSKSHANLTLHLPGETDAKYKERIKREVDTPVTLLRERLGEVSFAYAYPYGDVNEWVVNQLTRQKVRQGLTVTPGGNGFFAYPFMLRRSMVFGSDDLEAFKGKLVTFVRTPDR